MFIPSSHPSLPSGSSSASSSTSGALNQVKKLLKQETLSPSDITHILKICTENPLLVDDRQIHKGLVKQGLDQIVEQKLALQESIGNAKNAALASSPSSASPLSSRKASGGGIGEVSNQASIIGRNILFNGNDEVERKYFMGSSLESDSGSPIGSGSSPPIGRYSESPFKRDSESPRGSDSEYPLGSDMGSPTVNDSKLEEAELKGTFESESIFLSNDGKEVKILEALLKGVNDEIGLTEKDKEEFEEHYEKIGDKIEYNYLLDELQSKDYKFHALFMKKNQEM